MSYIDRIRALDEYLETNSLSPEAQLIYYKLLSLFNKARWPESVQVENSRLQALCSIDNERTFRRHKDKLVATGLVGFIKGRMGSPNRYTLPGYKPAPDPEPQPEEPAPAPAPKKKPAKKSAPKKSAPVFVPPTKDEVRAYCRSRVSPVDPDYFWEYFNASDWMDKNGKPVLNWKGKLVTWEKFSSPVQQQREEPVAPPKELKGHLVTRVDAFGRKRTVWVEDD